jgi:hypothetical protein
LIVAAIVALSVMPFLKQTRYDWTNGRAPLAPAAKPAPSAAPQGGQGQ